MTPRARPWSTLLIARDGHVLQARTLVVERGRRAGGLIVGQLKFAWIAHPQAMWWISTGW